MHTELGRAKLDHAVAPQHQKELYQIQCTLSSELDVPIFETRMAHFIKVWKPLEQDIVKYFSKHQSRAGICMYY